MEKKPALIVIACCILIHITVIGSDVILYHTAGPTGSMLYLILQGVIYLLFPLLGWITDVYITRYRLVLFSFFLMIVGAVPMILACIVFITQHSFYIYYIGMFSIIISLFGLGLFQSTAIQFGMDQMLEASSEQLSTFVHWYFWSSFCGRLIIEYILMGTLACYSQCATSIGVHDRFDEYPFQLTLFAILMLALGVIQLVCVSIGLCMLLCSKKHLVIDRTGQHPLKLIYMVLKYSWNHKCPERRSAFTYWEEDIPARIDLGKSKYGGPFTTEEVEDTKTFFRILLLLLAMVGFHLTDHGYSLCYQLMKTQCPSFWVFLFVGDPMQFTYITVGLGIPVHQFFKFICCGKQFYRANMLKTMGLGLLCCLIKEVAVIVIHATMTEQNNRCHHIDRNRISSCYLLSAKISVNGTCYDVTEVDHRYYCDFNTTPFLLTIIPSILQGLSILLVFMTALEFICAQAPLRLKGLLIGLWYATFAVNYLLFGIPEIFLTDPIVWEVFHEVKAFLIFILLIVYLCVSRRYHYRVRDEIVPERTMIEDIFMRQYDLRDDYFEDIRKKWRRIIPRQISLNFNLSSSNKERYGTFS